MESKSVAEHFAGQPCPICKAPLKAVEVYGPASAKLECEGQDAHGWRTFLDLQHAKAGADFARVKLVPAEAQDAEETGS